jgi:hypothetical protein
MSSNNNHLNLLKPTLTITLMYFFWVPGRFAIFLKLNLAPTRPCYSATTIKTSSQLQMTIESLPQLEEEQNDSGPSCELRTTEKSKYPTPQRDINVANSV